MQLISLTNFELPINSLDSSIRLPANSAFLSHDDFLLSLWDTLSSHLRSDHFNSPFKVSFRLSCLLTWLPIRMFKMCWSLSEDVPANNQKITFSTLTLVYFFGFFFVAAKHEAKKYLSRFFQKVSRINELFFFELKEKK